MASIRIEFRFGWLSLAAAAAAAYYMRPTDESFRPVLSEHIKKVLGLSPAQQQGGSLLNVVANKIADVAVNTVAEHGIQPQISDYYVCKLARVVHPDPSTGKDKSEVWVGAFSRWFRIPLIAGAQLPSK